MNSPNGHHGRVVIVTGASSGLARQLAAALAAAGATPILAARRADRLAHLREELPGADAIACDVTDAGDRERLVATVLERHGRLDGLVNNAGAGETGGGAIVNVASVMGLRSIGEIPDAAYVASKAGIIGLTRELASQWGRYGIRVNAVAPGFFASEMTAELGDDPEAFPEFILSRTPLRRGGRPGELDEAVLFLLGAGSSFVTGHVLSVDGGMAIR